MPKSKSFKNICGFIGSCSHFCFPARAASKSGLREVVENLPDDIVIDRAASKSGLSEVVENLLADIVIDRAASKSGLREVVENLPDDIVIDILSSLSAKDVLMCRRVCKKWRDLISSQGFLILHMRRGKGIPMVYFEFEIPHARHRYALLENWMEPAAGTRPILHCIPRHYNVFESCHGGLIVLRNGSGKFVILNPFNYGEVNITLVTGPSTNGAILGVFFHPSLEEYCTLWEIRVLNISGAQERVIYRLLNLGSNSKPCWRDIRNQWPHMWRYPHRWRYSWSISVNDYIYWIVQSPRSCGIMAFGITSEEITLMPLPVAGLMIHDFDGRLKLVNVDGVLSLVVISSSTRLVNVTIWTLENHSNWLWKSSDYSFMGEVSWGDCFTLVPIAICDGKLLVELDAGEMLIVCNLKLGTTRPLWNRVYSSYGDSPLVMSLVSLRNCMRNICMDEKEEIEGNAS